LPGDYNDDGIVDAADYTIWRDTLDSTIDLRANGDNTGTSAGLIDQADYDMWKLHFGETVGSGANANHAISEPGSLAILLGGILTIFFSRKRRRRFSCRPGHASQHLPPLSRPLDEDGY
jgi:hypothetical protein